MQRASFYFAKRYAQTHIRARMDVDGIRGSQASEVSISFLFCVDRQRQILLRQRLGRYWL